MHRSSVAVEDQTKRLPASLVSWLSMSYAFLLFLVSQLTGVRITAWNAVSLNRPSATLVTAVTFMSAIVVVDRTLEPVTGSLVAGFIEFLLCVVALYLGQLLNPERTTSPDAIN